MNITNIAVFMFAVLLSVGAVDGMSLFAGSPAGYDVSALNNTAASLNATGGYQVNSTGSYAQASIWGALWYIVEGFEVLLTALYVAAFTGVWIMQMMPWMPASFVFVLQGVIYVVYGIGIIQFLTGRSEKMMK
jgi:hypothetical protein